jgi:outer membrane protein
MKKFLFIFLSCLLVSSVSQAQKFGYIDSNFILSKMPAYGKVQQEIDKSAEIWQREVEKMQEDADKLKQDYRAEEVLLTDQLKKKRLTEIANKEAEVREYQRKVFGYEGLMFKRRQDLMRPIQDEVFVAVEKVAKAKKLQVIFDKSGDMVMIYTDPVHDYTEYVLEELGLASELQNKSKSKATPVVTDGTESNQK